jgi:hypothetical protein
VYATNRPLAYEIYERAKLFGQNPSDCALLPECVGEIGRFYFDRGIWAFGRHVTNRLQEAGQSSNASIAQAQREREWEKLMGGDMTSSATGFADPSEAASVHSRVVGEPSAEDEDLLGAGGIDW